MALLHQLDWTGISAQDKLGDRPHSEGVQRSQSYKRRPVGKVRKIISEVQIHEDLRQLLDTMHMYSMGLLRFIDYLTGPKCENNLTTRLKEANENARRGHLRTTSRGRRARFTSLSADHSSITCCITRYINSELYL